MSADSQTLILGIGSDFGDDQLGMVVAQRLAFQLPTCKVLWLRSPLDIGDYLASVERLQIVDACRGMASPGTILRYDWPSVALSAARFCGTHDFGLVAALQLTEQLLGLPPSVTIWCIEASDEHEAEPGSLGIPLSPLVASAVDQLIENILLEVNQPLPSERKPARHA